MKKALITIVLVLMVPALVFAASATQRQHTSKAGVLGFHHTETIASGNGTTIAIPAMPAGTRVTCTMIAGANSGKFQITTSSDAAVAAGTCTWVDWSKGAITGTDQDVVTGPITGIRGVSTSGSVDIEIVY